MKWFYIHKGERHGPIEGAEFFQLSSKGRLEPEDLIWNDTMGEEWARADTIPGLISRAEKPLSTLKSKRPKGHKEGSSPKVMRWLGKIAVKIIIIAIVIAGIKYAQQKGIDIPGLDSAPSFPSLKKDMKDVWLDGLGVQYVYYEDAPERSAIHLIGTAANRGTRQISDIKITAVAKHQTSKKQILKKTANLGPFAPGETKSFNKNLGKMDAKYESNSIICTFYVNKISFE